MRSARALLAGLILFTAAEARGAEGATSLYSPGFFGSMAGMMPDPGAYGEFQFWAYSGDVEDAFLENQVVFNIDSKLLAPMFTAMWVTDAQWLGGQYGFSFTGSLPHVDVSASLTAVPGSLRESESTTGFGDVVLSPVLVGWHRGNWHWMGMVNVYVPTGDWDEDDLATTGLNRWAVEPGLNVTYFSESTGREMSLAAGYTLNFRNQDTRYHSGDEFHLDLTLGQWLPSGWMVGAGAYLFQQITDDEGAPAVLGGNKGRVYGLGPTINYSRERNGVEWLLSARYFYEFGARNRPEGHSLWLRASFNFR